MSHSGWWPWTKEHIVSGDMERSFLAFILATDADILTLNTNNNIQVLHVCFMLWRLVWCGPLPEFKHDQNL